MSTPLTLDELRQMDGEPVWVKVIDHDVFADKADDFDGWGMVRTSWVRIWDEKRADLVHIDYHFEDYGKEWLAYSDKPGTENAKPITDFARAKYKGFSVEASFCPCGPLWCLANSKNHIHEVLCPRSQGTHPAVFRTKSEALWFLRYENVPCIDNDPYRPVWLTDIPTLKNPSAIVLAGLVTLDWDILSPEEPSQD